MNYSTLFPEMLKQVPRIKREDMCYHYQYKDNDNNHTKIYIPSGKRLVLWFLNFNDKKYSVLLEFNDKTEKIEQCYFQYMSFKPELTEGCGTLVWCTKVNKQFCLNKIIYWMGKKYTNLKCFAHMNDLKYMLENYIHSMNYGSFFTLTLPIMGHGSNILLEATSLPYDVYCILSATNQQIRLYEYSATFRVEEIDSQKDIYQLICLHKDHNDYEYMNAYVNDLKTSVFMKRLFQPCQKNYQSIEFSDDEDEEQCIKQTPTSFRISCIYLPRQKSWKPYKRVHGRIDFISKIKFIENKKYESNI